MNFAKFIEWPAGTFSGPDSPLVIGILGDNPFGRSLEALTTGRATTSRPLTVRTISSLDDAARCHIVFIAAAERRFAARVVAQAPTGVLTVGETDGFADRGGVIQFTIENNRVRFLINPDAAKQANLQVSAKLLGVARIVPGRPAGNAMTPASHPALENIV